MKDRILFKGRAQYEQVPQILCNASILLTAQPRTVRAQGGFPTKLGEYMMSMNPVLLTNVGEIPCYVKDGIDVFMAPPESPEEYAEKIVFILENKSKVIEVTKNAYELAISQYGNTAVTKTLLSFLVE